MEAEEARYSGETAEKVTRGSFFSNGSRYVLSQRYIGCSRHFDFIAGNAQVLPSRINDLHSI